MTYLLSIKSWKTIGPLINLCSFVKVISYGIMDYEYGKYFVKVEHLNNILQNVREREGGNNAFLLPWMQLSCRISPNIRSVLIPTSKDNHGQNHFSFILKAWFVFWYFARSLLVAQPFNSN